MREITFSEALGEAILEEMSRDPTIFTYGEDIAKQGGIFGAYKPILGKYQDRIIDTPISEEVIFGSALGAALAGMRPVAEFHFADFLFTGMAAIANQIMKFKYMTGGQGKLHLILRGPDGISKSAAAQHSESIETIFMHIPGIKVIIPSTPYDMKGLFKTALRSDDPVICFEHKMLYRMKGPVPEEEYYIPFGVADVKREGKDVTVIATSRMVHESLLAAQELEKEGVSVEVVDLRTLVPWDKETVFKSVKKTHKVVIAHETWRRAGWGAEIAATIQEELFDYLDAPIRRVGAKNVHIPFSPPLQDFVVPDKNSVIEAVRSVL
ncbi:alpha-ketoacid dehydrogenase subunit beta [Caldisericum exile]|uniref:Acetoin dehydrogenase E1 component beta subunit n=2 Tax=Caldisericum exile TaxID=693075 RepID=A0A7U6JFL7_CALEA|nr:alpha-ketoacid dehydrogenase subunit beta [Caldisericum exile]BAL80300.1 acetoin dehydrogenase E1 component beta subunit [Caldisericum exile AZM16c01]